MKTFANVSRCKGIELDCGSSLVFRQLLLRSEEAGRKFSGRKLPYIWFFKSKRGELETSE